MDEVLATGAEALTRHGDRLGLTTPLFHDPKHQLDAPSLGSPTINSASLLSSQPGPRLDETLPHNANVIRFQTPDDVRSQRVYSMTR